MPCNKTECDGDHFSPACLPRLCQSYFRQLATWQTKFASPGCCHRMGKIGEACLQDAAHCHAMDILRLRASWWRRGCPFMSTPRGKKSSLKHTRLHHPQESGIQCWNLPCLRSRSARNANTATAVVGGVGVDRRAHGLRAVDVVPQKHDLR